MRFSILSAFAILSCTPFLSGCEDTQARDGRSGSTATITQNGESVTSSTGGDGQIVIRRSGGGGYDDESNGGSSRRGAEPDADRLMESMRNRAGNALER